jgi:hypothetical protein
MTDNHAMTGDLATVEAFAKTLFQPQMIRTGNVALTIYPEDYQQVVVMGRGPGRLLASRLSRLDAEQFLRTDYYVIERADAVNRT